MISCDYTPLRRSAVGILPPPPMTSPKHNNDDAYSISRGDSFLVTLLILVSLALSLHMHPQALIFTLMHNYCDVTFFLQKKSPSISTIATHAGLLAAWFLSKP